MFTTACFTWSARSAKDGGPSFPEAEPAASALLRGETLPVTIPRNIPVIKTTRTVDRNRFLIDGILSRSLPVPKLIRAVTLILLSLFSITIRYQ
jgi:hypothetical protein